MTPERWHQITEIYHAARERDPARRDAFVAEQCLGDPTLQREVEAMLDGLDDAGQFGESPLFTSASSLEPGPPLGVTQLATARSPWTVRNHRCARRRWDGRGLSRPRFPPES